MSQQLVNTGTTPNDGTGDPLRNAFTKLNANDTELYAFKGAVDAANGIISRTGAGAFSARTLVAGSAKITVTNGNGVAGNPTIDFGSVASTDLSDGASLYKAGGTDVAVADGGTGASTASAARTNLGLGSLATLSSVALTGDISGSGAGSVATTLATVNSNTGSFGSSTAIPVITVNAKGLITAVTTAPAPLIFSGAGISHTGDTTETTLATITIPANSMGANGVIEVFTLWEQTNANSKTGQVRFGGTSFTSTNATVAGAGRLYTVIHANGATNAQIGYAAQGGYGFTSATIVTGSIDTTAPQNITITGQLTSSGDTIKLDRYFVRVTYGA